MGHGNNDTSVGKRREATFKRRSTAATRTGEHHGTTNSIESGTGSTKNIIETFRRPAIASDDNLLHGRGASNNDILNRNSVNRRLTSPRPVDHHSSTIPISFEEDDSLVLTSSRDRRRHFAGLTNNHHAVSTSTTSSSSSRSRRNLLSNDPHRAEIRHLERAYDVNEQRIRHLERMVDQLTSELHQTNPSDPSQAPSLTQHHHHQHHHRHSSTPRRPPQSVIPNALQRKKSEK